MQDLSAELLDRHGYQNSVIHELDPRAKIGATIIFIITVLSFGKSEISGLTPYLLFPLASAILGFVPFRLLFRQLVWALPFIALIGIFNPIFDRAPGGQIFSWQISSGWLSFFSILFKGILAISATIILIATTSFPKIIFALQELKIPHALTTQLILLYRYLFVLVNQAQSITQAKALRASGRKTSLGVAGSMLSVLLTRTVDRGERIYQAMQMRGFEGELKMGSRNHWQSRDSIYLIGVTGFCIFFRFFPMAEIIGRIVMELW